MITVRQEKREEKTRAAAEALSTLLEQPGSANKANAKIPRNGYILVS